MNAFTTQRAAASSRLIALLAAVLLAGALLAFGITEEVPLGGLAGKAVMKENGKALEGVTIDLTPTNDNQNEAARRRSLETDEQGRFDLKNLPSGDYTIQAYAKAHHLESQRVTVTEGKPTVLELSLVPNDPDLNLSVSQRVFLPSEKPSFQMSGFLPEDAMGIDVFKIDLAKVVEQGSVEALLRRYARYESNRDDPAKVGKSVRHLDYKITGRDVEGTFQQTMSLDELPVGFYLVRCQAGKIERFAYMNVSKIGLVTKSGATKATCFVTDLQSGTPIEGANLSIAANNAMKPLGVSKPDGTLDITLPKAERHLILAQIDSSVAVVDFYGANSGGEDEEGGEATPAKSGRVFVYSDRPIYKPGDLVQFKGIARSLQGIDFKVPAGGTMVGELRDPDDNLVQDFEFPLSPRGTFSGKFSTNVEAKPGLYTLLVSGPGGSGRLNVHVAAYRKPEFKITVTPEKKFYVFGDKAKAKVKCEYYFGGPVVGAKVSAYVSRSPYWSWDGEDTYDEEDGGYADESGSGESIGDFEAVTDENGEATIEFDTERPEKPVYGSETDYDYTIQVSAAEEGDKYFDGQGSVRVTRGAFATSADTSDYLGEVGTPVELDLKAFSHIDKKPLGGKQFEVVVGAESWVNGEERFAPIETLNATTGADGKASIKYTPKSSGSILFKTTAVDENGNKIQAEAYLYVEGSGAPARPGGKLTVTADKKKYQIGDTAKIMIQTDTPGGFALMTVEADEVLYEKVVNLTQALTIVQLGVEKNFGPNARVAVAYIREKQFYEAGSDLMLDLVQQKMKIQVTPDRPNVLPGSTVNYSILTTDMAGQPISADLSLGVVDESIYAIRADDTNIFKGFFPRRAINVQTTYSFPEVYLDGGDKGGGNIPIRTKFQDTAYWNPNVHTDAAGKATVSVPLPDNLTSWRATVVGITDSTMVGIQSTQVRASKPLMIRLETPGFMVVQDKQKIAAVVQNDSGQAADVKVYLEVKGIQVEGDANQTIHVEPGTPQSVEWDVTANQTGQAEIVAKAEIVGGANDGVKHTIDVKPHGRDFEETQSGLVKGNASFDLVVRDGADRSSGRLVLNLSPSIATTLVQSLDELVKFPYGCVEQTMSRFLPAILVDKALGETGLARPDLHAKVPAIAADGLARLAKMQHGDGGWGWWEYDDSDPFMTALVLDGLSRAKGAGVKVNESMIKRGLEWAKKRFDSAEKSADLRRDLVYLCFAMAENGEIEEAKKRFVFDFAKAGAPDLALGVMTASMLGPDFVSKRDALLQQLRSSAIVSGGTARWGDLEYCWGAESTAFALAALVKVAPNDELIPKAVRYLMETRKGDYWESTRDTAYVLIGMTAYLKQTKELANIGGTFAVSVNGKEIRRLTFDRNTLLQPDLQLRVPISELQPGKNTVQISQSGNSVCYYSANLKQVVADTQLGAVVNGSGLTVQREYFKMEVRRMEDGTMKLAQSEHPVTEVRSGDVIKCVLTVTSNKARQFVMVEDPTPSNCRVTERDAPYEDEAWGWWWASTVVRDDRVSFFARELPAGTKTFSFVMRAESNGKANALPTRVGNMYDPEDVASSSELPLKVNPR